MNHLIEVFKLIMVLEQALKGEDIKSIVNDVEDAIKTLKSIKDDFESKSEKP